MTSICLLMARINAAIIDPAIALIFAAGFLLFIYGVVEFLFFQRGEKGEYTTKGREHMLWGIIGMAIMMSAWGIIKVVAGTFSLAIPSC